MKNGWDGVRRAGFTIIEVMLFLAISGFLLIGILAGAGAGIARQRYNDSVQSLAQILREQYSGVINTQIPVRGNADVCYSPAPSDVTSGGEITRDALGEYYNADGTLKVNSGRGRTSCLVYGVMITFGGHNGEVVQTSQLIGKDIETLVAEEAYDVTGKTDLQILKAAGVNNLSVFYEFDGGSISNFRCYVRTTEGNMSHNLQWEASTQRLARNSVLESTVLIVRSPTDGAVRTYVWDQALKHNGSVVDYASINSRNDGKGWGLVAENSGTCSGTLNSSQGGYQLLNSVGVNAYLENFKTADVEICVGTKDLFVFATRRRMINLLKDGHNTGAVELIDMDALDANGVEKNKCE